jgi:predicted nucleic acid-binding protein
MDHVVADTNIVIWYFTNRTLPSAPAQAAVAAAQRTGGSIYVPSITIVELIYLIEKNRIDANLLNKLREALDDDSTAFELVELTREIADEIPHIDRSVVGDMPDRIIAATALHLSLPLVTSDRNIQKLRNVDTIW